MNIEYKVTSVGQEQPVGGVEALLLGGFEFFKERGDMYNTSGSDEIDSPWIHETLELARFRRKDTRWENMEVVFNISHDYCMASIISALEVKSVFGA